MFTSEKPRAGSPTCGQGGSDRPLPGLGQGFSPRASAAAALVAFASPGLTGRVLGWVPRCVTIGRAFHVWGGASPSEALSLAQPLMGACPNRVLRSSQNRRHPAGSACAGPPRSLRARQAARGVLDRCARSWRPRQALTRGPEARETFGKTLQEWAP